MEEDTIMKLLIITQKVDKNDAILGFFHSWIEEFSKHFENILVVCLERGEYELPGNVVVYSLGKDEGVSRSVYLRRFYYYIFKLQNDYDAVFVHMNPVYVILGGLFWRVWQKKITLWYTHKKVDWKLKVATLLSNKIFTASYESFRLKSKKINIIGHGIDTDFFTAGHEERTIPLLTVGRISLVKRLEVAISTMGILKNKEITYTIVGKDLPNKYLENLLKLCRSKDLTQKIFFEDAVTHEVLKNRYLQKADIFVHTSETGSLDKAVLEAMSCGVIPITSSEAFYDLLKEYKDILIFEKGSPETLAKKIETLLQIGNKEKEEIRKNLREKIVQNHNLHKLIHNLSEEIK